MIPTQKEMQQALVERCGAALQEKFSRACVAVCGLGGLGSNIAIALARAGVGRLHLIDFDRVDLSNLNRQQYFANQLGMYKTDALRQTLAMTAPYCEVVTDTLHVTAESIPGLFRQENCICEAFDRPEQKAMLVNGVLEHYPKTFLVAGSGMAGLGSANRIRTRKVTDWFYLCGDEVSNAGEGPGLLSARVLVCAAHEANMVLRLLAGKRQA
ncbi:MAG: sulfur carrier protein ThiS adenylyltransferase ThiF [Oscillospiraceae bacterium]|jgi:sulfur carrier protein ThiS adenylyltransferase|nr:sulfur carrier protein ThiS adenylyltransferase ThiF [Oscillospiraceae bacterium]MDD3260809.1 sulfur carrier protein ThiS adenylyltransferase ThiF [Oscillospiraceae bacterium]